LDVAFGIKMLDKLKPKRASMELSVNEGISISRVLNTRVDNYSNYDRGPLSFTPYLVLGNVNNTPFINLLLMVSSQFD
jgi:hypothetical protein